MNQRVMIFLVTPGFARMRLYGEAPRAYHVGPVLDSNVKAINAPGTIMITVSLISKRF